MIFNRVYNINWNTLGVHLLPMDLRKPKFSALLRSFFKPNQNLHTRFINYRREINYKIDHTPQVFSMEKVLNDSFDQIERRIYITDGFYLENVYFFNPEENSPIHFYNPEEPEEPPRFYDPSELAQLDVDFIVVLPFVAGSRANASFAPGTPQYLRLKSLVDTYRLPDKTYQIIYS
jgi:hypothetical protein